MKGVARHKWGCCRCCCCCCRCCCRRRAWQGQGGFGMTKDPGQTTRQEGGAACIYMVRARVVVLCVQCRQRRRCMRNEWARGSAGRARARVSARRSTAQHDAARRTQQPHHGTATTAARNLEVGAKKRKWAGARRGKKRDGRGDIGWVEVCVGGKIQNDQGFCARVKARVGRFSAGWGSRFHGIKRGERRGGKGIGGVVLEK